MRYNLYRGHIYRILLIGGEEHTSKLFLMQDLMLNSIARMKV